MILDSPPVVIAILVPAFVLALTIHEFCHALTAYLLGDDTAEKAGRLSMNPLVHLDLFGTLLLFLVGFGYAKPVPVNIKKFKHPRRDEALVAAAGPGSNFLMALAIGLSLRFAAPGVVNAYQSSGQGDFVVLALMAAGILAVHVNLLLAILNILPIYPLDGAHVLENTLPIEKAMRFRESARFSMIFFLAIFFIPQLRNFIFGPIFPILHGIVGDILGPLQYILAQERFFG